MNMNHTVTTKQYPSAWSYRSYLNGGVKLEKSIKQFSLHYQ